LNVENLRRADDCPVVVLDWENCGPLQLERELAMIIADLAADFSVDIARAAYDEYRASGGPARVVTPADFSTAIAVQGHLLQVYSRRALEDGGSDEDRSMARRRLHSMLRQPLTGTRVTELLDATAPL
jgi:hypothetical protein